MVSAAPQLRWLALTGFWRLRGWAGSRARLSADTCLGRRGIRLVHGSRPVAAPQLRALRLAGLVAGMTLVPGNDAPNALVLGLC